MILEESSAKGPDTGEDKVDFIEFSGRVGWSVVLSQQAIQQGTQCLIEQNTNPTSDETIYSNTFLTICKKRA